MWTPSETQELLDLHDNDGMSFARIARVLGKTRNACKNKYAREKRRESPSPDLDSDEQPMLEKWKAWKEKPTWEEIIAHAKRGQELQDQLRPIRTEATRTIQTSEPIFVVFMADFHLGSPYTDYDSFLKTADLLKSDDRLFFCVVGPDLETSFTWFYSADATLNQTIPPYMQIEAYKQWLDSMMGKAVAVCGDNHTDVRLERKLGDIGLVWRDDLPYFRTWGLLKLVVGDEQYEIVMAHKYKGSSVHHDMQPVLRMFRETYPLADIYVTAHTHKPAHMSGVWFPQARGEGSERQHMIVTGTFKTGNDPYTVRNFGSRGVLGLPTIAFWPNKKQAVYFESPEIALELM